ncbi:TCP-1/cpn60 chaperonin family protein [Petroclostridium sp. X23]|uniref:TCP-1/cpn60 chaperonin family protein n=1 Tax=Petroclostridium sp. X23 TaxID=3045146 RepID=UPI0024AE73BF|nr:TCP-1/cpn60 chaperonin family protein [Petroclostridium sp. X23]WHH58584.1 TCP-1/cpn60 chaperonin family protein [Petroclostridium sp. X23]
MYNTSKRTVKYCNELARGTDKLATLAEKIYGTDELIQYMSRTGEYKCTTSFGTIIQDGMFKDEDIQRAVAVLNIPKMPKDGVKTALILCNELIKQSVKNPECEENIVKSLQPIIEFMKNYLKRIAKETEGILPGGGLYLMNLGRPLSRYALHDQPNYSVMAQLMISVLAKPLLTLAENANAKPYEVYERVKVVAPNQFFSLNHFGLERSIDFSDTYTDIFKMGFDIKDGKIKDLMANNTTITLEEGIEILDYLVEIFNNVLKVAAIV